LRELEALDPALAQVVEMRYFGGYTDAEIAVAMEGARLVPVTPHGAVGDVSSLSSCSPESAGTRNGVSRSQLRWRS